MEKFYLEVPGISRKEEALAFVNEFYECHSEINGTGSLVRYREDYEAWLQKLNQDYTRVPSEEKVPARTYFLIRVNDDKIIGMINIRLSLNEKLRNYGGNIGYCIRPKERGKGYNKINLYLGLKVCDRYGIDTVLMDADLDNPASWKTMEALGGVRKREYYDDVYSHCTVVDYHIDVKKALAEHPEYENYVFHDVDEYDEIIIKKMETDDEIKGKAYVQYKAWHEAYPGIVDPEALEKLTLEKCEEIAFRYRDGLIVAKDKDHVIGFVGYGNREEEPSDMGEVFSLYVLKEYYGKGVGKRLMEAALIELKEYPQICLWVLKENERAIRFYHKCGFTESGEEKFNPYVKAQEIRMIYQL